MTTNDGTGRFSAVNETLPEGEQHTRVGRFGDGQTTADASANGWRVGRFSTGSEALPESEQHRRVGRFGDSEHPRGSLTIHSGAQLTTEVEVETVSE